MTSKHHVLMMCALRGDMEQALLFNCACVYVCVCVPYGLYANAEAQGRSCKSHGHSAFNHSTLREARQAVSARKDCRAHQSSHAGEQGMCMPCHKEILQL